MTAILALLLRVLTEAYVLYIRGAQRRLVPRKKLTCNEHVSNTLLKGRRSLMATRLGVPRGLKPSLATRDRSLATALICFTIQVSYASQFWWPKAHQSVVAKEI